MLPTVFKGTLVVLTCILLLEAQNFTEKSTILAYVMKLDETKINIKI